MLKTVLKLFGWKVNPALPNNVDRCVMIAVPHTSNWDFFFARITFAILKIPVRFTIKKEWMTFPFKGIMTKLGAIPIDRSPKKPGEKRLSMVEAMSNLFKDRDRLVVLVTPEGTRSLRTEWKTGFYYVAKKANVPIGLGYLDYEKKEAGVGKMVYPSDNPDNDFREIMTFYKDIAPKHPANFSLDLRYVD